MRWHHIPASFNGAIAQKVIFSIGTFRFQCRSQTIHAVDTGND